MKQVKTKYFCLSGQLAKNAFCENLFLYTLQTTINNGFAGIEEKSFL